MRGSHGSVYWHEARRAVPSGTADISYVLRQICQKAKADISLAYINFEYSLYLSQGRFLQHEEQIVAIANFASGLYNRKIFLSNNKENNNKFFPRKKSGLCQD